MHGSAALPSPQRSNKLDQCFGAIRILVESSGFSKAWSLGSAACSTGVCTEVRLKLKLTNLSYSRRAISDAAEANPILRCLLASSSGALAL